MGSEGGLRGSEGGLGEEEAKADLAYFCFNVNGSVFIIHEISSIR